MTKFVVGLDAVVTGVSVAAFVEGADAPVTRFVRAPRIDKYNSVTETARTVVTANDAVESVLRSGVPVFVMMMKPTFGKGKDDSAPRRMMLAGEIQRQLLEAHIPVAEVPSMALVSWLMGAGRKYPPRDFAPLEQAVRDAWRVGEVESGFRLTTVAVAAAAAVVAGIETRKKVENSSLAALSEMRLPDGWELPARASEWNKNVKEGVSA
ncbi:hypothetical protein [Mycobacteroides abscessus]|uniref:Uncharacterized protein n=1 Tax=Mycobacteroides abscessus subsp. abscessus TaxID=1185650 RepID=A0AB38D8P9_9MYCO|nr:hypothetical protein [Mycobacteroides abscessus]SIB99810.1 Uncharacterised protein [Mycobacteroides abscessus subsp. abscessus]SIC25231.1 Uncharacterised protein [Mycobacteroides abscessus subsp. abscessus]SIC25987.1 Uncharacterised protein [Mycobacteroides abscessus subsp. abscessus]SIC40643.1 Uncharacterised protein [Mycobacteroides abscessus subsp. abscessus]SIF77884.1 Uncharacterised protein [Mycobacteroides abscessus subsp. abscessus]